MFCSCECVFDVCRQVWWSSEQIHTIIWIIWWWTQTTGKNKDFRLRDEMSDTSDELMDSTVSVCVFVCLFAVVYLQKWEKSNKLSFTDASRCLHMEITISCVHELCLDVWISWIMCVYLLRRWLKLRMSCAGRFQISLLTWASQGSSSTQVSENHTRSAFEESWCYVIFIYTHFIWIKYLYISM